jgi:FecR protein
LAAFSTAAWAQVGYVHEISCTVSIQRPLSNPMTARVGDTFEPDTIFRTGMTGKTTLRFADGQIVVLGADTMFRVGQYRFDANNIGQSSSAMTLSKGEMRFVTGVVGDDHRDGIRITAGISTISILNAGGADFTVGINPDPREVGFAAVAFGEIGGRTPYGATGKVAPSQYVPWQPGRTLTFPAPVAAAPAVIQAATMGLFATVVPANAPVNVASAADAARLTALPATAACPTQAEVPPGAGERSIADVLAALPATAAGPANASGFPLAPILPPVTPGSGGRCTGSVC